MLILRRDVPTQQNSQIVKYLLCTFAFSQEMEYRTDSIPEGKEFFCITGLFGVPGKLLGRSQVVSVQINK